MPPGQCLLHAPATPKLSVKFPADGDIFRLDPQTPRAAQVLFLKAAGVEGEITWTVDGLELAEKGESILWPLFRVSSA